MLRLGLIEFLCRVAILSPRRRPMRSRSPLAPARPAPGLPSESKEIGQEAADELSMKQASSLRDLAVLDWKEFVDRQPPWSTSCRMTRLGIHPGMSFASREHYRRIVQRLARRSPLSEEQVARAAIGNRAESGGYGRGCGASAGCRPDEGPRARGLLPGRPRGAALGRHRLPSHAACGPGAVPGASRWSPTWGRSCWCGCSP